MRTRVIGTVMLIFLLAGVFYAPQPSMAFQGASRVIRYSATEIIVHMKHDHQVERFNQRHGTYTLKRIPNSDYYLLGIQAGAEVSRKLAAMLDDDQKLKVGHNFIYEMPEVQQTSQAFIDQTSQAFIDQTSQAFIDASAQAYFYGQPTVSHLRLAQAHQISLGSGVKVAVIDTGIDASHPLLAGRIAGPVYDFVSEDVDPNDEPGGAGYGHGTFVSGLIALTAPQAMIMPIRAFDSNGQGTAFNIARAIRFAVDNGAKVINMSFGMYASDPVVQDAVNYAYGRAFMVASAGNDNQNLVHFPASIPGKTLAVTSVNADETKSYFSNFNFGVNVSAPGHNVYSAYPDNRWAYWSGTSFSTAMVAGEAALLRSIRPNALDSILYLVISTSGPSPDPFNPLYVQRLGLARIDFRTAVERIQQY
ncbi:MAG: S8 family serine peptidase [Acidobacteria bacterium]|nr:S8 family serine peptidase [Acidobacteriota bacterium]MCW5968812.1 S8 family serine peptidase [Blastocatellales bacterium]